MTPAPIVSSHDEWSPLEEVIVGRVDGAVVPPWGPALAATAPAEHRAWFEAHGGRPFPPALIAAAARELDDLCRLLEGEGVRVRRPDRVDWGRPIQTPDFGPVPGFHAAMPRDALLVIGDEIIEAPMAWRCRHLEALAYRALLREYFVAGARWTAAPRPRLADALYDREAEAAGFDLRAGASLVREHEPVFDAADFSRCGRDLFCQRSHVTNRLGVAWLRRHLGPAYRIHELDLDDPQAMHIDASFVPLRPGKLLVNPLRVRGLPPICDAWERLIPPPPVADNPAPYYFSSRWLALNVLSLDEERVLVEASERPLQDFLRREGFTPIPAAMRSFGAFGGGLHCATLDVRRRGPLASWF